MPASSSASASGEPYYPKRYVVGLSGASGAIYFRRLVERLLAVTEHEVHCIVTPAGRRVLTTELDPPAAPPEASPPEVVTTPADPPGSPLASLASWIPHRDSDAHRLVFHPPGDIGAGPASGTFRTAAMIVVPCSMNTLGAIAGGISNNLLTRAAAVTLKEGRPLILVPRETPFTLIDLRNMTRVAEAGGVILPANPGFYHRPESVEAVVDYVVQKILDRLGLDSPDAIRWGEG